ncbi:SusD/RagB family nutrient-binding outer membrane lipoprotein [Rufibacter sp. XAAS-G3-1]|uniref:SusD/RagB family nutrient-binding outer membrane lipoprotein n=1 Tax=Rufibacter sp. XAAS-G3-1 TaxID=2729134 RepID=UPI0015E7AB74|nr:SusD/RagB family nutrient-binding outer membrane lipoprotein [Rufibacter sp. XAAS-G3-1]
MKKIKLIALSLLTVVGMSTLNSCTEDFEELNTNPNTSPFAMPESLLAPALTDMVKRNLDRALRLNNELMQVHVARSDNDEIHRYVVRSAEADYMWNNWYTQITDFKDIYSSAEVLSRTYPTQAYHKTFMGVGLICEVWAFSLLTDMYGDIPYFNANKVKEGILMPAFDKQEAIYADLFRKLEEANTLLSVTNGDFPSELKPLDPLYNGSATNWRKFGNSLYLRLLLRVSGKPDKIINNEMTAAEKIGQMVDTSPATYPIISSNAESAILRFTGTAPYQSPFQTVRDADWNTAQNLAEFFVNNLNEWGDPRITVWATLREGRYAGIQSGYETGRLPAAQSSYLPALRTNPLLGNILNYPEVQLILAEAALKGYIAGSPKTYYETGATNGITLWGLTVPAGYLTNEEVMWEENYEFEKKMDLIHLQKYYALFFTDFQQWYEYRRTGHPVLPIGPGVQNNGQMPSRLNYPLYVQSLNRENYLKAVADQGSDDINTKVWWQQ